MEPAWYTGLENGKTQQVTATELGNSARLAVSYTTGPTTERRSRKSVVKQCDFEGREPVPIIGTPKRSNILLMGTLFSSALQVFRPKTF